MGSQQLDRARRRATASSRPQVLRSLLDRRRDPSPIEETMTRTTTLTMMPMSTARSYDCLPRRARLVALGVSGAVVQETVISSGAPGEAPDVSRERTGVGRCT